MIISNTTDIHKDEIYQHSFIRSQISSAQLAEIESWPTVMHHRIGTSQVMFCHGNPIEHVDGYAYEDSDLSVFSPNVDVVFMGNTHRPFIRTSKGVTYVNVGSCGLPRDHGGLGSAAIFDPYTGEVEILRFTIEEETSNAIIGVPYVHESVIESLKRRPSDVFGVRV
jgi:predicted phosphodiesterase